MADLPADGRTSKPAGVRPQLTPTRVRVLLARAGEVVPVYRSAPGDSDGPLNEPVTDPANDGWTDTWYSSPGSGSGNPDPEMDTDLSDGGYGTSYGMSYSGSVPGETAHETWHYHDEILVARAYPTENEESSDGSGVSQTDEAEFVVPADEDVRRGDRLIYDGMVYEVEAPTDRDGYVRWTAAPDIG